MSEAQIVQLDYKPTKKAEKFHASTDFVQVHLGGMGSGKSRAAIQELVMSGIQYPGIPMAVYRKTLPSLRDSTLHEYKSHVPDGVGEWRERDVQYRFHVKNEKGHPSFVNFRGLDESNKAKSTEYALIVIEEADEMSREDFLFLKGRVRKKGPWPLRIILLFNPCDEDHWLYKEFGPEADKSAYLKAGGLLVMHWSTYDNIENLPENYIEQNTAGMTPDEIDRYVHGQWGSVVKGEPVYAKLINPALHLRKFERVPGQLLLRGWDFGFNHPACSFRLVDNLGRKNCAFSMMGDKEELDIFALRVKRETQRLFPDCVVRDFGDPRGHDKTQNSRASGPSTAFEILQDLGIFATGERGVREYVEPGIKEIRRELSTLIQGIPELTIDPSNTLIRVAYAGGKYVRGDDGKPRKDGYWEHVSDADRYIPHHHKFSNAVAEAIQRHKENQSLRRRNSVTGY
jgi:hypothetical protein